MNFISHFYLDKHLPQPYFTVGVSTPDLLSVFNSDLRLRERRMPLLLENDASEDQMQFYNGVMRHFEADKLFHSSDFFFHETKLISKGLKEHFTCNPVPRRFFVSHVLLELMLDKVIIQEHPNLLERYYEHFNTPAIKEITKLSEWVARNPLPSYDHFLEKYIENEYLYNYHEWTHVVFVLRKIMQRVGITQTDCLSQPAFIDFMAQYEVGLSARYEKALRDLMDTLVTI